MPGPVDAPPTPSPPTNYGGFAGRDMPDLPIGTQLAVSWWDGREFLHAEVLVVGPEDAAGRLELPWERIQDWSVLP